MQLARFPRRRYTPHFTPLEPLPRLSEALGGPEVWIKRDDLLGLAAGGNKTRKLEFLVADADSGILSRVSQLDAMASQGLQVLPVFSAAELQGLVAMTLTPDALRLAAITVDGVALVADLATGSTLSLPCYCKPSGIQALRGRPVFRLSNPEDGAIAVLDARAPSARVVVIPPEVTP